jgi:hypothetical protein
MVVTLITGYLLWDRYLGVVDGLILASLLIFYQLGFVGCLLDIDTAIHQ